MVYKNKHKITQTLINAFAGISGDHNPLHVDPVYAETTKFKKTIAHGVLVCSLVSSDLVKHFQTSTYTPIIIATEFNFLKPVFSGDEIEIEVHGCVKEKKNMRWTVDVYSNIENNNQKTLCIHGLVTIR